jgi:hypothetical protein
MESKNETLTWQPHPPQGSCHGALEEQRPVIHNCSTASLLSLDQGKSCTRQVSGQDIFGLFQIRLDFQVFGFGE